MFLSLSNLMFYYRLTWVVGTAGAVEGTLVVLTGCTVVSNFTPTFLLASKYF